MNSLGFFWYLYLASSTTKPAAEAAEAAEDASAPADKGDKGKPSPDHRYQLRLNALPSLGVDYSAAIDAAPFGLGDDDL
jgi:hypothetical protein